jgi:hypothetical protein
MSCLMCNKLLHHMCEHFNISEPSSPSWHMLLTYMYLWTNHLWISLKHILVHLGCYSITKTKQGPFTISERTSDQCSESHEAQGWQTSVRYWISSGWLGVTKVAALYSEFCGQSTLPKACLQVFQTIYRAKAHYDSKIHNVFHVSQLKLFVPDYTPSTGGSSNLASSGARQTSRLEHAISLFSHWSLQEISCCSRTLVSAPLHVQIEMNLFIRISTSNIL